MSSVRGIEIKGGAGELEAAVIAVVLDHIDHEESAARLGVGQGGPGLPAWVRAIMPGALRDPRHQIAPGDRA